MLLREGSKLGTFFTMAQTNPVILWNLLSSGVWFYLYNELATLTIKKTGAVTASVANTAKRVIVIVVVALAMGESLNPLKLVGCSIGIGGVFLYSVIDKLVAKFGSKKQTEEPQGSELSEQSSASTSAAMMIAPEAVVPQQAQPGMTSAAMVVAPQAVPSNPNNKRRAGVPKMSAMPADENIQA
jgi:hypothetical protein